MDSSLCLYKEKLKEALVLVPTMSAEKKVEAVAYWNDLAEQLQEIVHKSEANYNQPSLEQNLNARTEEHSDSLYNTNTVPGNQESVLMEQIQCNTNVIPGIATSSNTESTIINSTIKQSQVGQFIQEDLINKTIFENSFLGESPISSLEECKDHLPDSMSKKLAVTSLNTIPGDISSTYVIAQPEMNCSPISPTLNSTSCSTAQSDSNIRSSPYPVMKHSTILTQVPNHTIDTKSILDLASNLTNEVYCSNVDAAQASINGTVHNYLGDTTANLANPSANKLSQSNMNSCPEFDNIIIADSLGCPRTTANLTNEIGNGQFDRGPKLYTTDEFDQFNPSSQTIRLTPTILQNTFVPTRNEMFTHSDRPLQQIQLFNPNTSGYIGQSYALINNRVKYLVYNTSHDQLELSRGLEKPQQNFHPESKDLEYLSIERAKVDSQKLDDGVPNETNVKLKSDKVPSLNSLHTCEVCGKSGFSTKGNLKRHLRAHSGEKPFKCEYCESCFTEKKSLKIHVRRHTGEKPYKCEICGKLFSQTGVLQSHMALHLNERKFDCQKCGKAFRQRSQLKLHLMRHDGVKRLECSTCLAKFLTKGDLERHCRIHTGERPYACKICNKTFTRQQSLNEHMNRHTGRKPYDCKYCDKTFSEMSACYKHAKTHKRQEQPSPPSQNLARTES